MYSPEDLEFREQQRLSKALQGKLGSQNQPSSRKSWAPVQTKQVHHAPVNTATQQLSSISISDSPNPGVDTTSIYPGAIVDEKVKQQEAQRLKKMGLHADNEEQQQQQHSSSSSSSLNSSTSSMTKSTSNHNIAKETSSSNLLQYQSPVRVANSTSSENLVDNASIMNNVDAHSSEEKMKQEAKRLERWGLKINTPSTPSPSTTSPTVTTPHQQQQPQTPTEQSIPSSPFTTSAAVSVNSQHSNLPTASTQQFLDRIILSAKSVKQIIQKKTSNRDITIAILMDLVKESANFGMNLSADSSMSFDISQNAGKLAGAVNELVKDTAHENNKIFDEIVQLLGLLYLAVVAN